MGHEEELQAEGRLLGLLLGVLVGVGRVEARLDLPVVLHLGAHQLGVRLVQRL